MKYVDPDGCIAVLAEGADTLADFNDWLREQSEHFSDSFIGNSLTAANGVARGVTALGEGFLRTVNYGANWASVATGGFGISDEWGAAHAQEIQSSHQAISDTYDYFANQDGFRQTGQQLKGFGQDLIAGKNSALSDLMAFGTSAVSGVAVGKTTVQYGAKLAQQGAKVVRESTTKLGQVVVTTTKSVAQKVRERSGSLRGAGKGVPNSQTIANASSGNLKELLPTSSLNNRQLAIHEALTEQGAVGQFHKKSVSMTDLKAITQVTGDEYNMFTLGSQRTIIRGYGNEVSVSPQMYDDLLQGNYGKWSGHTHPPGYSIDPGPADRPFLQQMGQQRSAIWGDNGHYTFGQLPSDDALIQSEIMRKQWERIYGD